MPQKKRKSIKGNAVCRPQLTSLIDVMTILLVFLMVHFSVEGNLITPSSDLDLPLSSAEETPESVTMLEITSNAVRANDEHIVDLAAFPGQDSLSVPQIAEWLRNHRSIRSQEIMLQADRHTPFAVMKRVMYTCNKEGFDDFTILVRQEG